MSLTGHSRDTLPYGPGESLCRRSGRKPDTKKGRSPGLSISASHAAMFDAISLFGAFTVVETVNRTHQIAGDTADALKTDTFAHHLDGLLFKHGSAALGRNVFCVHVFLVCNILSLKYLPAKTPCSGSQLLCLTPEPCSARELQMLRFAWSLALLDSMSNFKTNCSMLKS